MHHNQKNYGKLNIYLRYIINIRLIQENYPNSDIMDINNKEII